MTCNIGLYIVWQRPEFHRLVVARSQLRSVAPILAVFAFIVPFWSLWDQSLSTWVMQGDQMKEVYKRDNDEPPFFYVKLGDEGNEPLE